MTLFTKTKTIEQVVEQIRINKMYLDELNRAYTELTDQVKDVVQNQMEVSIKYKALKDELVELASKIK